MARFGSTAWGLGLILALASAPNVRAQTTPPTPKRTANINVLVGGVGTASYDHEQFSDEVFPNLAYQRRIFRRESRRIPIWVRGAFNFLSEDRDSFGYTVWQAADEIPFPENVQEHTSDFTLRGEMLADFLHGSAWAVYGGAGFGLHSLNFTSNGVSSEIPTFKASDSGIAPSAAAGVRVFAPHHPITAYAEARWLRVYGKTSRTLSPSQPWLIDSLFEFTNVGAWSIEGGLGLHW